MTTPYESIGGEGAVRRVLRALYDRLFDDPMVGFLFEGKDKERIVDQQAIFTCAFLGGPQRYEGTPLPQAHAAVPILPGHFDRRHHLLRQLLREQSVPDDVAAFWLKIDEGLRSSVISAGAEARAKTRGG